MSRLPVGDASCPPDPPPPASRPWPRVATALTHRDFRVLWAGACVSTIGTWMQKVAQS